MRVLPCDFRACHARFRQPACSFVFALALGLTPGLTPDAALGLAFSIDGISPAVTTGLGPGPDDIFVDPGAGAPLPALPPAPLLIPGSGLAIELDGLSFGRPASSFSPSTPALFSVDRGTSGVPGSALAVEFSAALSEQSSDVFSSGYTGSNALAYDGDGIATAPNPAAPPLAVAEPATFPPPMAPPPTLNGDVDALDARGSILSGGSPTGVLFSSFSGGAAPVGVGGADVLIGAAPYATAASLGLLPSDDIDALIVFDDGDGVFLPGTDIVVFSLAPGSPSLGALDPLGSGLAINEGDILVDDAAAIALLGSGGGAPAILHPAESLGLFTIRGGAPSNGNLNALDLVPEPSTGLLVAFGLLSLGGVRRRARTRG